jgi:predicted RecA/RadA family phage recombinase
MTTKFKASGQIMDYVAGSAVLSGAVLVIGTKIGVALADIAAGATGSVQMAGVFEIAKLGTDVVAQGALLYWDVGNSRLTTTVAANVLAGHAYAAAGNGPVLVQIVLNSVTS